MLETHADYAGIHVAPAYDPHDVVSALCADGSSRRLEQQFRVGERRLERRGAEKSASTRTLFARSSATMGWA
jgi:hypothetical protein